jgi:hypothetical protein
MHFNRTFSSSLQRCEICRKFLVSLESPDRHSLLAAVIPVSHWSALYTPKYLRVLTAKNPEDWGQEIVQASGLGLRVLSTAHRKPGSVLSDNAKKMKWRPIMHEPHVISLMKRHMFQEYWQIIHQKTAVHCACYGLLGKTTDPENWSPEMPTQTLTRPHLSGYWFLGVSWLGLLAHLSE